MSNAISILKKKVAEQTGLKEVFDEYIFLARLGDNYRDYKFNWEPFRDLAGPLEPTQNSIPILVMSDAKQRPSPEVQREDEPSPHFEIRISPVLDVVVVANTWLDLVVDNGARLGSYKGPFDWFPRDLNMAGEQLSAKGRSFLSL